LAALYEGRTQGQVHISDLDFFQNFVFKARVLQFHLVFEIEYSLGILTGGKLQLFAYGAHHRHLDVHVEIEIAYPPLLHGQVRVIDVVHIACKAQFGRALWTNIHKTAPENFVEHLGSHINFGDDALTFNASRRLPPCTLSPVFLLGFFAFPPHILVVSHGNTVANGLISYFFAQNVSSGERVIFHHLSTRTVEVQGIAWATEWVPAVLHRIGQTCAVALRLPVSPQTP